MKKTDRILSVASRDNAGKSTLHTSEEQVDVSSEEDLGVMWEHGLLDESQREVLRWGRTSSGQLEDVTIVEETLLGGAAAKSFFRFAKWTWGLYKVRAAAKTAGQLGREGEAAVRAAYNIGEKPTRSILMNGRARIPDGLRPGESLSEVKNVDRLSFTRQLRDYAEYARSEGLRFDLYTRPSTRLSRPLQDAIDSGIINHLHIP